MPAHRSERLSQRESKFVYYFVITGSGIRAALLAGAPRSRAHVWAYEALARRRVQLRLRTLKQTYLKNQARHIRKALQKQLLEALRLSLYFPSRQNDKLMDRALKRMKELGLLTLPGLSADLQKHCSTCSCKAPDVVVKGSSKAQDASTPRQSSVST